MSIQREVKIKSTGKTIIVYKLKSGGWCDASNCRDTYSESDLILIKKIN